MNGEKVVPGRVDKAPVKEIPPRKQYSGQHLHAGFYRSPQAWPLMQINMQKKREQHALHCNGTPEKGLPPACSDSRKAKRLHGFFCPPTGFAGCPWGPPEKLLPKLLFQT